MNEEGRTPSEREVVPSPSSPSQRARRKRSGGVLRLHAGEDWSKFRPWSAPTADPDPPVVCPELDPRVTYWRRDYASNSVTYSRVCPVTITLDLTRGAADGNGEQTTTVDLFDEGGAPLDPTVPHTTVCVRVRAHDSPRLPAGRARTRPPRHATEQADSDATTEASQRK